MKLSRSLGTGRTFCLDLVAFILNLFKQSDSLKARNKIKYVRNFIFFFFLNFFEFLGIFFNLVVFDSKLTIYTLKLIKTDVYILFLKLCVKIIKYKIKKEIQFVKLKLYLKKNE